MNLKVDEMYTLIGTPVKSKTYLRTRLLYETSLPVMGDISYRIELSIDRASNNINRQILDAVHSGYIMTNTLHSVDSLSRLERRGFYEV